MRNLGWLYRDGLGVAQDYGLAREWYEKAAAAGNVPATTDLGWLYQKGLGITRIMRRPGSVTRKRLRRVTLRP
jgi:TPR repeat protein